MELPIFQVDAFTNKPFHGNPASVVILDKWLSDDILQKIAQENNLSETAFVQINEVGLSIRWFTPKCEVELCGHATLAAASVVFEKILTSNNTINFQTKYAGDLMVTKKENWYLMEFPMLPYTKMLEPEEIVESLGAVPNAFYNSKYDFLAVYDSEKKVADLLPDFGKLSRLKTRGVIVTAQSQAGDVDFISRYFAPSVGVNEDPVTGSAHSVLIPFWNTKLNKTKMLARQISKRGGLIKCEMNKDTVTISGQAVCVIEGNLKL